MRGELSLIPGARDTANGFMNRGPEVESWFGAEEGTDPAVDNEWPLLPFMALSDGAHV
jgi:Transport protein Avl9